MSIPAFYKGNLVRNNLGWGLAYDRIEKYIAGTLDIEKEKDQYEEQLEDAKEIGVRKISRKLDAQPNRYKRQRLESMAKLLRLDRYLKVALTGRSGKYAKLTNEQLKVLVYCLVSSGDAGRLDTIRSTQDLLHLAMRWFYPRPTMQPRVSRGISDRIQLFEKMNRRRVCFIGHGAYISHGKRITVPQGMHVHFYAGVNELLQNSVGKLVEGFLPGAEMVPPLETYGHPERIENYFLSYPTNLSINTSGVNSKFERVIIPDKGSKPNVRLT